MKRERVYDTLCKVRTARSLEEKQALMLCGIHELLYELADKFDCFEDEYEEDEQ